MGHTHYHSMKRWASRIMLSFLLAFTLSFTVMAKPVISSGDDIPMFFLCVDTDETKAGLKAMANIMDAAKIDRESVLEAMQKHDDEVTCGIMRGTIKVADFVMKVTDFEGSIVEVWTLQTSSKERTWYGMTRYKQTGVDS